MQRAPQITLHMNASQPASGAGLRTLLKRVLLIFATLLVVAGIAGVIALMFAPASLPGDVQAVLTPPATLAPVIGISGEEEMPAGVQPAPAPAISYATPVYIESGNHTACTAQAITLPFSGSQDTSHEYNIYRFNATKPALRLSISNYNNIGEVLIYAILEDACSTTGKMAVRFLTSVKSSEPSMDADIVEGITPGNAYLLAVHTTGRLNDETYALVLNEIEAPTATPVQPTTATPAVTPARGQTATFTSTATTAPTPTTPALPDAVVVSAQVPDAPANQPPVQAVLPAPQEQPSATTIVQPPATATRTVVLPTRQADDTNTPAPTRRPVDTSTPAPSATITDEPTLEPRATSTARPTNTAEPTNTPRPTATPRPTDTSVPPTATPRPTNTARPTSTAEPTNTPRPTATPRATHTSVPPTALPTATTAPAATRPLRRMCRPPIRLCHRPPQHPNRHPP